MHIERFMYMIREKKVIKQVKHNHKQNVDNYIEMSKRNIENEFYGCQNIKKQTVREFKRAQSIETRIDCVKSVQEAIKV